MAPAPAVDRANPRHRGLAALGGNRLEAAHRRNPHLHRAVAPLRSRQSRRRTDPELALGPAGGAVGPLRRIRPRLAALARARSRFRRGRGAGLGRPRLFERGRPQRPDPDHPAEFRLPRRRRGVLRAARRVRHRQTKLSQTKLGQTKLGRRRPTARFLRARRPARGRRAGLRTRPGQDRLHFRARALGGSPQKSGSPSIRR